MEKTAEQILTEYISGDREAIRMIYVRYKTRLFNFCLRLLDNRADAEEVPGDVFMTLIAGCTYDPERNIRFSTWIYTVARNTCVSRMRKRKYLTSFWHSPSGQDGHQEWDPPDSRDLSRE
ncbi:MAG TPA: sigma factor [Candidatus Omnitrophota bacterium]|nr:sigma factor [Candidatus Omnitrophota bacterium]HPN56154.1 sigma factor [Candidatus Omnitrophota bacterium]